MFPPLLCGRRCWWWRRCALRMTLPEGARKRLTLCTVCCARCACIAAPARPVPPSPPEFIASNEARPPRPSLCAWDTVSPCCHAVGPRGVHWPPASTSSGWTWYPFAGPRRFSGSASLSGLFSLQLQVGGAAYCQGPLLYLRGPPWDCMPCVLRPICVYRLAVCAGSLSLLWLLFLAVRSCLSPHLVAAGPAGAGTGAGGTRCGGARFRAASCTLCAIRAPP
jgi:hypothetical protein